MGSSNFSAYSGVVNAFDFKDMVEDIRLKQEDIIKAQVEVKSRMV